MKYFDRKTKSVKTQKEYGDKYLHFLYKTVLGRIILKFVSHPIFSNIVMLYKKSPLSKRSIKAFVTKYEINLTNEQSNDFKSFNHFFTRKEERDFCDENKVLHAVADSKLSVFKISNDLTLNIKNTLYSINDLLKDEQISSKFYDGTCLVFRLSVQDMHRYFYFDNGKVLLNKKINGKLHTVRPISEELHVFTQNKREVTLLKLENFGLVTQVEIGALLVGRIKNHPVTDFKRGDEKGYFEFGGSTIVLLFKSDIKFDDDIIKANAEGLEISVKAGERIGELC